MNDEPTSPETTDPAGAAEFIDRFRYARPFSTNRVTDPTGGQLDVPSIHDRQFHSLVEHAEHVRREPCGMGVVVWGEPGIGKSHLLARLCRWADEQQLACYIFLHNVQASPERLPRYVLKCVISRLAGGRAAGLHGTKLYWLVMRMIKEALRRWPPQGDHPNAAEAHFAYLRLAQEWIAQNHNAGADSRRVYEVLFRFFLAANDRHYGKGPERPAQLALRWLSGDDLDATEAAELGLGLSGDDLDTLPDEQSIQSVLVALAEHARCCDQTMLLCFDQVDNLADEQMRSLSQFLHPLIENARNLLVITSGVQQKLLDFVDRQVVLRAAWERIAQSELRLNRIDLDQARQLLELRLEKTIERFATVEEVRRHLQEDTLFPLGRDWLAERFSGLIEVRPRDVINWARDRWDDQRRQAENLGGREWLRLWPTATLPAAPLPASDSPPPTLDERIDEKVSAKIQEQIARRTCEPDSLPPDAANLAGLVESLLAQALAREPEQSARRCRRPHAPRMSTQPAYDLTIERTGEAGPMAIVGAKFLATGSANSASAVLRRMIHDANPPPLAVLVTDQRQPLHLGSRGQEYLDCLTARGPQRFQHLELTLPEYADLDALQAVVGDARSGDLEIELGNEKTRPVTEAEVTASHHRHDRYRRHRLLRLLLAGESAMQGSDQLVVAVAVSLPTGDDRPLRRFIHEQLTLTRSLGIDELVDRYLRTQPAGTARGECRKRLVEAALKMHQEGDLQATPHDDQLLLRPR
jgi:hypothetical protein